MYNYLLQDDKVVYSSMKKKTNSFLVNKYCFLKMYHLAERFYVANNSNQKK